MGEEPERLRAALERLAFLERNRGASDENATAALSDLDSLLAEVERLGEEWDGARLEALGLRVEVERLTRWQQIIEAANQRLARYLEDEQAQDSGPWPGAGADENDYSPETP